MARKKDHKSSLTYQKKMMMKSVHYRKVLLENGQWRGNRYSNKDLYKIAKFQNSLIKAAKLSKNRRSRESRKHSRQQDEEDKSESLSVSREDNLDEASPRRRRKGTLEAPKRSSLYDVSYAEDDESVKEVSTRARRTRKGTVEDEKPSRLDRQLSKQSLDDVSKKDKTDGTMKRRNTNKKIDSEKAKAAALIKEF